MNSRFVWNPMIMYSPVYPTDSPSLAVYLGVTPSIFAIVMQIRDKSS